MESVLTSSDMPKQGGKFTHIYVFVMYKPVSCLMLLENNYGMGTFRKMQYTRNFNVGLHTDTSAQ